MQKILPISTNPIISCYNDESFKYNIAEQFSSYKGWISMEYIGLCMHNDVSLLSSQLKGYHNWPYIVPNLEETKIQRIFFKNYLNTIDIVQLIINNLNDNTYVYLFLNEYYIPNRTAYKKNIFIHDNLVIGFDTDKSIFYLLGYNTSGLIEISEVSFLEFKKSFEILNEIHEELSDIFFLRPEKCSAKFDMIVFYRNLEKYVSGTNLNDYLHNFNFGINIYDNLIAYYQQDIIEYDLRNSQKLLEHKQLLLETIIYINENILPESTSLIDSIKEINNLILKCEKIKKLTIKYNVYSFKYDKKIETYRKSIINELITLSKEEILCLNNILKKLSKFI